MLSCWTFFLQTAQENYGTFDFSEQGSKEEHGGITAEFAVFDIYGEDVSRFCRVMNYVSGISMDATKDGVYISVTVSNIFVLVK